MKISFYFSLYQKPICEMYSEMYSEIETILVQCLFPVTCFESTVSNSESQAQEMHLLFIDYMTTDAERHWRICTLY